MGRMECSLGIYKCVNTSIDEILASFQMPIDDYIYKLNGVYGMLFSVKDVKLARHKFKKR